jgi:hypothetical protein
MRDFIIVTPRYASNSNGIKTLHKICHTINILGGSSKLAFIDSNDPKSETVSLCDNGVLRYCGDTPDYDTLHVPLTNPEWNTPLLDELDRPLIADSYVLYPEVMTGNPLNGKRVIRYFGNREGFCNGKMIGIGDNDFLLAHSITVRKNAHCILFNSEINPAFHDRGALPPLQRPVDATYVGKGHMYGDVEVIKNTVHIGRSVPEGQDNLAKFLRNTRIFYTWDSWSCINVEAVLCGAIPFFLRYDPWTEEDLDGSEIGHIPRLDKNNSTYDAVKFEEERRQMRVKIDTLAASWERRVREVMNMVEQHFDR